MSSSGWFTLLVLVVAAERLAELVVARRNLARARRLGAVEHGASHYPWMVALHTGFLAAMVAEVWLLDPPWLPWLGWPMLGLVVAAQALRWWCITALGWRWNTRVVVVPGWPLVRRGPYRWFAHPNYVAVVVEGAALPLVHTAAYTAVTFTVLNAWLLHTRVRVENAALAQAEL
jgi:methyltransferase